MAIQRITISATGATGGAGVATATARTGQMVKGTIRAVHLAYLDSPPAGTTDVTLEGSTTPKIPVLTITNAATDGWFFPMNQADNTAGADITNQGSPVAVEDYLDLTIAQANNADGITATIIWDDGR
jgi:hypothetical protein